MADQAGVCMDATDNQSCVRMTTHGVRKPPGPLLQMRSSVIRPHSQRGSRGRPLAKVWHPAVVRRSCQRTGARRTKERSSGRRSAGVFAPAARSRYKAAAASVSRPHARRGSLRRSRRRKRSRRLPQPAAGEQLSGCVTRRAKTRHSAPLRPQRRERAAVIRPHVQRSFDGRPARERSALDATAAPALTAAPVAAAGAHAGQSNAAAAGIPLRLSSQPRDRAAASSVIHPLRATRFPRPAKCGALGAASAPAHSTPRRWGYGPA